jgi:transcriptional regulator with XRE-family HTH domain
MDAAVAIRNARVHAGLSKRELARRAGTSPASIVLYESGERDPTVGTLARILTAAGAVGEIDIEAGPPRPDPVANARALLDVLELAEHLPKAKASKRLAFPPFPRAA